MNFDADEIASGLWQGSAPPIGSALERAGFVLLVLCARDHQPPSDLFGSVTVLRAPLDDSHAIPGEQWVRASEAARRIAQVISGGGRVLVTCQAGLNRSGLVSALTLRLLTGMSGREAARIVQMRRHRALSNTHFVAILGRLPARGQALGIELGEARRRAFGV